MSNFKFSGHTHHVTNWHNLEICFVLELLNRVSEGLVLELPVRSIGCSHSMHVHPRAASLGHPLLLHQQGPHAHLNLTEAPCCGVWTGSIRKRRVDAAPRAKPWTLCSNCSPSSELHEYCRVQSASPKTDKVYRQANLTTNEKNK